MSADLCSRHHHSDHSDHSGSFGLRRTLPTAPRRRFAGCLFFGMLLAGARIAARYRDVSLSLCPPGAVFGFSFRSA